MKPPSCLLLLLLLPDQGISLLHGEDYIYFTPDAGTAGREAPGQNSSSLLCPAPSSLQRLIRSLPDTSPPVCPLQEPILQVNVLERETTKDIITEERSVDILEADKAVRETFESVESQEEELPKQQITLPSILSSEKKITEENILPFSVSTEPVEDTDSSFQPHGPEEEKPSVEEEKVPKVPYIVKAVPIEVPSGVKSKTDVPALDSTTTVEDVKEELEPFSTVDPPPLDETSDKFLATENSVEEEPLVPANETVGETVDVIAPFSQWAEKKIEEEEKKKEETKKEKDSEQPETGGFPTGSDGVSVSQGSGKPGGQPKANGKVSLNKNFASPDCSAKIVGANTESQGSGNVITGSRDEYFLNKCSDKSWFVVELCESIKALKVQIANFELYSSSPKEVRVSIGNVYPGRDKDWMEFGTFLYEDERSTQTFKNDLGVVGKYAKVEVLSYHGSEHYCPMSLFKVFGISEIDLITEDDMEDADDDDPTETTGDVLTEHIIVKTIKDAVHKVVNVFRPENRSLVAESLNTSSLQGTSLRFQLLPPSLHAADPDTVARYRVIHYLLATQYSSVKRYTQIMGLGSLLPHICPGFSIPLNTTEEQTFPWQWAKFVQQVHGEDFLLALCNVVSMEAGLSPPVERVKVIVTTNTETGHADVMAREAVANKTEKNNVEPDNTPTSSDDNVTKPIKAITENTIVIDSLAEVKETVESKPTPDKTADTSKSGGEGEGQNVQPASPVMPSLDSKTMNQQVAAQTTWQKLSARIKALERNVTLSTGFLEELSRKYIKQVEELNTAIKVANDAITDIGKKEEQSRQAKEVMAGKLNRMTNSVEQLSVRLEQVQEEVMTRHGLLILGEVMIIGLVFIVCRPGVGREKVLQVQARDRRGSLDTCTSLRRKQKQKKELEAAVERGNKRRSSIEIGTLPNGHVGTMQGDLPGLSRRQKKRKRRRESAQSLRNLAEDSEEEVYSTFHGRTEGGGGWPDRDSRSEPREDLSPRGRFVVGPPVFEMNGHPPDEMNGHSPCSFEGRRLDPLERVNGQGVEEVVVGHSRNNVRFGRGRGERVRKSSIIKSSPPAGVSVSNMYGVLERSVQETEESSVTEDGSVCGAKSGVGSSGNTNNKGRSKSSSPNRQTNLLLRTQRERVKKIQSEKAEWLQRGEH